MLKLKKDLKGKKFECKRIAMISVDDIPGMRKHFQKQIDNIDGAEMTETETAFEFSNGQFVLKPKYEAMIVGVLICKSSMVLFKGTGFNTRIEYADIKIIDETTIETISAIYKIISEV
jgi:hypothetical protein